MDEKPGRLQSIESQRLGRNSACTYVYTHTFFFVFHYGDRI